MRDELLHRFESVKSSFAKTMTDVVSLHLSTKDILLDHCANATAENHTLPFNACSEFLPAMVSRQQRLDGVEIPSGEADLDDYCQSGRSVLDVLLASEAALKEFLFGGGPWTKFFKRLAPYGKWPSPCKSITTCISRFYTTYDD